MFQIYWWSFGHCSRGCHWQSSACGSIFEHGHQALGAVNSPFNSWLALRGIRTMPVRLAHQSQAIQTVLSALQKDPRISRLYHPFVGNQQQQALAEKYLTGLWLIVCD